MANESMVFKGLDIKYPEYTVITPQMGLSFGVRSLTVSEVSKLKLSNVTPSKANDLVNRVLFDALTDKPGIIKTFDEFMSYTTLKDREALIYALYIMTFGEEKEFRVQCDNCNAERMIKLDLTKMFSMTPYIGSEAMENTYNLVKAADKSYADPVMEDSIKTKAKHKAMKAAKEAILSANGEDEVVEDSNVVVEPVIENIEPIKMVSKKDDTSNTIIEKEVRFVLPVSKIYAVIHQPNLKDEADILNDTSFIQKAQIDLLNETLIIKRFEKYNTSTESITDTFAHRTYILSAYQELPYRDKEKIYTEFRNHFSQYGIALKADWACVECSSNNTLDLDIVSQFFRMVAVS